MHYERNSNVHHWFPKVNHIADDYMNYEDIPDRMIVDDKHNVSYDHNLPPEDGYSSHRFY